jgi:hypothetical protein
MRVRERNAAVAGDEGLAHGNKGGEARELDATRLELGSFAGEPVRVLRRLLGDTEGVIPGATDGGGAEGAHGAGGADQAAEVAELVRRELVGDGEGSVWRAEV